MAYEVLSERHRPFRKRYPSAAKELTEGQEPYRGQLTPVQQEAFEHIKEKRRALDEKRQAGKLKKEEFDEAVFDASEKYYLAQRRVRDEVDQEFAKLESAWRKNRNPVQENLNLQRWALRYGRMSKAEVDDAIEEYYAKPLSDPDETECLLTAAVRTGAEKVNILKNRMETADYSRPWLATDRERVAQLRGLRDLHDSELGRMKILGPFGAEEIPVADLFDTTPIDEGDSE